MPKRSAFHNQAHFLRQLNQKKPLIWKSIPDLLSRAGVLTPDGRPYTIKSINHWKSERTNRRIPQEAIPIVCEAFAGEDKGETLSIKRDLLSQMKMDDAGGGLLGLCGCRAIEP